MVSVLFARQDSIYKTLTDCDVWDIERDALKWPGGNPIIAHPPCRAWGSLRHFAKPRPGERELALWAVKQVRAEGGVLEHPARSLLWAEREHTPIDLAVWLYKVAALATPKKNIQNSIDRIGHRE